MEYSTKIWISIQNFSDNFSYLDALASIINKNTVINYNNTLNLGNFSSFDTNSLKYIYENKNWNFNINQINWAFPPHRQYFYDHNYETLRFSEWSKGLLYLSISIIIIVYLIYLVSCTIDWTKPFIKKYILGSGIGPCYTNPSTTLRDYKTVVNFTPLNISGVRGVSGEGSGDGDDNNNNKKEISAAETKRTAWSKFIKALHRIYLILHHIRNSGLPLTSESLQENIDDLRVQLSRINKIRGPGWFSDVAYQISHIIEHIERFINNIQNEGGSEVYNNYYDLISNINIYLDWYQVNGIQMYNRYLFAKIVFPLINS